LNWTNQEILKIRMMMRETSYADNPLYGTSINGLALSETGPILGNVIRAKSPYGYPNLMSLAGLMRGAVPDAKQTEGAESEESSDDPDAPVKKD
jgi:hypothetical protein